MAIEVLSDLDWSDMNDCCEKCIHLHAAFEDVNLETPCDCPCHTNKGEKSHTFQKARGTLSLDCALCDLHYENPVHHSPTQPETTTSGWEERFTKLFEIKNGVENLRVKTNLKSFIHTEITHASLSGYNKGRLDVLETLERKLPPEEFVSTCPHTPDAPCDSKCATQDMDTGFNTYRTAVLNIIKSIKGE